MATIATACVDNDGGVLTWTWADMLQTSSDVGAAVMTGKCYGLTAQMVGTLGTGGEVTLEGSNDGSTWGTLKDTAGTDLVLDAIGAFVAIGVRPVYVRPKVSAGDGDTSVSVILSATR